MTSDTPVETSVEPQDNSANQSKRNDVLLKVSLTLLILGLLSFGYWFLFVRFYVSTDDAYVNGNAVIVMSPQAGISVAIYADNTQYVEQGQSLIDLDKTNFELAYNKAQVDLALAARQVRQLNEEVDQYRANIKLRKANLQRAQEDFDIRKGLHNTQALSQEDFNHAITDLLAAKAELNASKFRLKSAIASLGSAPLEEHPLIQSAKIALHQAYVNLWRARILAPVSGMVAKRNIQVGEWVTTTRALLTIIPLDQIWVDANFKETQLDRIRVGQPATIEADIYGSHVLYHGKVEGIVAGTGSVFSLLPPQNATGNWIKIVQRVPVRIRLNADELKKNPLLLGLSCYVVVDTSNQTGQRLTDKPIFTPQFSTSVFNIDRQPLDELIQNILNENLYLPHDQKLEETP